MKIGCSRLKYASDKTIKEKLEIWFIKDHSKAIKFRIFATLLKVASCILYILEVLMDPLSVHYSSTSSSPKSNKLAYLTHILVILSLLKIICYRNPNWSFFGVSPWPTTTSTPPIGINSANISYISPLTTQPSVIGTGKDEDIDWTNIFFVTRHPIIGNFQLAIAFYGLFESLFYFYLCYNVT